MGILVEFYVNEVYAIHDTARMALKIIMLSGEKQTKKGIFSVAFQYREFCGSVYAVLSREDLIISFINFVS